MRGLPNGLFGLLLARELDRRRTALGAASAAAAVAVFAVVGLATSSAAPQPEFPGSLAHNYDLSNSRNMAYSDINTSKDTRRGGHHHQVDGQAEEGHLQVRLRPAHDDQVGSLKVT